MWRRFGRRQMQTRARLRTSSAAIRLCAIACSILTLGGCSSGRELVNRRQIEAACPRLAAVPIRNAAELGVEYVKLTGQYLECRKAALPYR